MVDQPQRIVRGTPAAGVAPVCCPVLAAPHLSAARAPAPSCSASARGTIGHKVLSAITTAAGCLQIAAAFVLKGLGVATLHSMSALIIGGLGVLFLGQMESARQFEDDDTDDDNVVEGEWWSCTGIIRRKPLPPVACLFR